MEPDAEDLGSDLQQEELQLLEACIDKSVAGHFWDGQGSLDLVLLGCAICYFGVLPQYSWRIAGGGITLPP